nr:chromate efflux transporter [Deinobacterium chartae]
MAAFFRLGLTSFGGPVAHLGYFREEFVVRRRWLDDAAYADLVALCQFLPGPASSQVGMALGLARAGLPGALAAWLGFTLPSAALMLLFALGVNAVGNLEESGWLHGLKVVAVAVVAQAVAGMWQGLISGRARAALALGSAAAVLLVPTGVMQIAALLLGGLIGWWLLPAAAVRGGALELRVSRRWGGALLTVFALLLLILPLLAPSSPVAALLDAFYRTGSLVFGGGHVVLPLLEAEMVPRGWVGPERFVAGYGAAQAVPGPLFTFAAYLGAVAQTGLSPLLGAAVALTGIFLPAFLLVVGALPFWNALRTRPAVQAALGGVNAAVVGILLAALYDPVFTSAITTAADLALALLLYAALVYGRVPPWAVVLLAAVVGWAWKLWV